MYAQDSIDLLRRAGIDFTKHEEKGIDVLHFGELLMSSGPGTFRALQFGVGTPFSILVQVAAAFRRFRMWQERLNCSA